MPRWPAIYAVVVPTCVSGKPSSAPGARCKEEAMSVNQQAGLSRRGLLKTSLVGGFVLGFRWPVRAAPVNEPEQLPDHPEGQFAPNAFIRIDNAGKTTLVMPQAEMGQGVYTAIAMILAEELDGEYAQVVIKHAP